MITIVAYDPSWPQQFREIGSVLRRALGDDALAIHHIGSTSVPGLAAKDVIDIQITVSSPEVPVRERLIAAGCEFPNRRYVDHCPPGMSLPSEELAKHLCGYNPRLAHVHIREVGRFNQRYPLLCRDYLRSHPDTVAAYAEIKRQLAGFFPNDTGAYYAVKDPVFDVIMDGARAWAAQTGWKVPPTDA